MTKFYIERASDRRRPVPPVGPLTPQEVAASFPDPTHFLDGTPIPPGYLKQLYALVKDASMADVTEDDELTELRIDPDTGHYVLQNRA